MAGKPLDQGQNDSFLNSLCEIKNNVSNEFYLKLAKEKIKKTKIKARLRKKQQHINKLVLEYNTIKAEGTLCEETINYCEKMITNGTNNEET